MWFTKYFHFVYSLQPNIESNGKQMSFIRIFKLLFIQFDFMPEYEVEKKQQQRVDRWSQQSQWVLWWNKRF